MLNPKRPNYISLFFVLFTAFPFSNAVCGQSWDEVIKLTASDAHYSDYFGGAVVVSGNLALIGSVRDDDGAFNTGSVYVFELIGDSWTEVTTLNASDGDEENGFGGKISISGTRAIISAQYNDDAGTSSGSVYIFELVDDIWTEITKLTASDAASEDLFGRSVSISDSRAIVGAMYNDDGGFNSGSAYIFELSGGVWTEVTKLTASDAASEDFFGVSVAIDGDIAVIGASANDDAGPESGSAYIFEGCPFLDITATLSDEEICARFLV